MPTEVADGETVTLDNDRAWILDQFTTFVKDGGTLVIEPGTYILANGQTAILVIERGGTILAEGTPGRPIVMTSQQLVGQRGVSNWGGLILNGWAPINIGEGISEGFEFEEIRYGGGTTVPPADPEDSSGVLRYVRVEYAGAELSPENELNGIAFQGTGSKTVAEYLQVHFNKDDGVEFFGGTTNIRYLLLTGNADDSLDWTEGWTGKAQFIVAQQNNRDADQGIEADNKSANNDLVPRSNPTIYNATFIGGAPAPETSEESDIGALIREGTAITLCNAIVMGFGEEGVVIDHDSTVQQANAGNVVITNSMFFENSTSDTSGDNFGLGEGVTLAFDIDAFMTAPAKRNRVDIDPMLRDPYNFVSPDYRPAPESPALDVNYVVIPPDDGFFKQVHYIGGIDPGHDFTNGWTTHAPN
jgi:hypothetical protein